LEEVVVTAEKRAETIDSTPLSITALSMTKLQDAGVNTVSELVSAVPDLQIHTLGIGDFVGVTIRGGFKSCVLYAKETLLYRLCRWDLYRSGSGFHERTI